MALDPGQRLTVATLNKEIKALTEPIFRQRRLLALLRKKGRISFNHSGRGYKWRARYRRHDPYDIGDMDPITGARTNLWKEASLPWRAFVASEVISKFEKLANRGQEALIRIVSSMLPAMMESMNEYLGDSLYEDGVADTGKIHGLESWLGVGSQNTNSPVFLPSDTYAGLSTVPGTYGGSWTSGYWPEKTGDEEYCFWSPLLIASQDSDDWQSSTKTWIGGTARECLRYAQLYLGALQNEMFDVFLLNTDSYQEFEYTLEEKERIIINQNSDLVKLGYQAISYNGTDVTWEYGVPSADPASNSIHGYGLVTDKLHLMSMQGQLFEKMEDEDFTTMTDRLAIAFFGNLRIDSPAFSAKFVNDGS